MGPTPVPRCNLSPRMKERCKTWEDRGTETLKKLGYCFQPNIFKSGDSVKSASEGCRQTSWQLPKFQGNHVRFGSSRAVQEFVIYVRLKRSSDVLKVFLSHYQSGNKIEISISLKYDGEEFCRRVIPFESIIGSLDMKFKLRCSQEDITKFLSNLSLKIQAFVAEEPGNSKLVLETDEIVYLSLNHTLASLSICNVTDLSRDPNSVHYVNCYIFLDRSPCMFGTSENSRDLCMECSEGSHLITVFNEVKHSSGTIDLTSPQVTATGMEGDPLDTTSCDDDGNELVEPTDLSIKKTTAPVKVVTGADETAHEIPLPIPEQGTSESETVFEKSSSDARAQASGKFGKDTLRKADQNLRKVMTLKPIHRKHRGFPLDKFLMLKVKRMQQRLLDLQMELAENELKDSAFQSHSLLGAQVPSSIDAQSGPVTVALFGNDGSTAIVPSMSPTQFENETSVALVLAAEANGAEKSFKCPMEGCNERFNNKSSVSRHKKRIHFPHKLPKCPNCEHVFPRPYMLQRHLDHRVCLSK